MSKRAETVDTGTPRTRSKREPLTSLTAALGFAAPVPRRGYRKVGTASVLPSAIEAAARWWPGVSRSYAYKSQGEVRPCRCDVLKYN